MKKNWTRALSLLLAVLLCVSSFSVVSVYAEETTSADEVELTAAEKVQAAIKDLPLLENIDTNEDLSELEAQVSAIMADYNELSDEDKESVSAENLLALSAYFAELAEADDTTGNENNGDGGDETVWTFESVQALIDSLPDAETFDATDEDAVAKVVALLDEIDAAKLSLPDEEKDNLNYAKYDAICAVLSEGNEPMTVADDQLTDETYLWENLTNPDEDETGDVTLTVVTTEGETETYQYANIMDAVKKLFSYMNHGDNYQTTTSYSATTTWYNPNGRGYNWSGVNYTWDYSSAVISFTEAHCEYITTSVQFKSSTSGWQYASLSNVTFDGNGTGSIVGDPDQSWTGDVVVSGGTYGNAYGYGSYSNLKGTITISGDNCTIQNTSFIGNHTWAFTYYTQDNAIGVGSGVTGLTIKNNSFTGYTLVTAFGQSGGTVTNEVFDSNYVDGCLFLFHTADGGATNLTVTNNTLIGSATYTLASCMAYTTVADFSGNTLTYASFGLQNCETDMEQFLSKNTYDHGFIYQETVDYSWTDEELGSGTYYYLPSSTTVYTVLPDDEDYAIWVSDYNTAGSMDDALTYTQQDAINAAVAASEDPTYATLTWTGGGRDEDGNLLDGGIAIGYNYNALHLNYGKVEKVDVKVAKVWDDNDNTAGKRPESVTIELLAGGEATGKTLTLNDENNWSGSFTGLVKYSDEEAKTEIVYTIAEVEVSDYTTEITDNGDNSFTVTNTYESTTPPGGGDGGSSEEPEDDTVSYTVKKVWVGDDEDERPDSIEVNLLRNGKVVETATLSEKNNWKKTWSNLDADYKWTVEEVDVPDGYTSTVTKSGTTYTITNTYEETEEPEEATGTVTPEDTTPTETPDEPETPVEEEPAEEPAEEPVVDEPEEETPEETPTVTPTRQLDEVPETGDETHLRFWVSMMILSALGLCALNLVSRKTRYQGRYTRK